MCNLSNYLRSTSERVEMKRTWCGNVWELRQMVVELDAPVYQYVVFSKLETGHQQRST